MRKSQTNYYINKDHKIYIYKTLIWKGEALKEALEQANIKTNDNFKVYTSPKKRYYFIKVYYLNAEAQKMIRSFNLKNKHIKHQTRNEFFHWLRKTSKGTEKNESSND